MNTAGLILVNVLVLANIFLCIKFIRRQAKLAKRLEFQDQRALDQLATISYRAEMIHKMAAESVNYKQKEAQQNAE
uniref:Uncharacterized protein n=1 Tax=viral metagenome TaxID=1070528 RepID=A0A6M3J3I7_9ZZZZ